MEYRPTEEDLKAAIRSGRPVEVQGYILTQSLQANIDLAVGLSLENYDKSDLHPIVNSVVQEMALWGSLANMRQIYFRERGLDLNTPDDLERNETAFQESIHSKSIMPYKRKAKAAGLYLHVRCTHNEAGLRLEIFNNAVHSKPLEDRLRRLLREAMSYTDVMEYYRDNPEDQYGRGMGLAFSILMLKEEKLRPELMRMGDAGGIITSRLEIPFDTSFTSIRDRLMNDELIMPFENTSLIPEGMDIAPAEKEKARCPVCEKVVDEAVFFPDVPEDLISVESVRTVQPGWDPSQGACASCIALHGP